MKHKKKEAKRSGMSTSSEGISNQRRGEAIKVCACFFLLPSCFTLMKICQSINCGVVGKSLLE